jgi:hypothetical protein
MAKTLHMKTRGITYLKHMEKSRKFMPDAGAGACSKAIDRKGMNQLQRVEFQGQWGIVLE